MGLVGMEATFFATLLKAYTIFFPFVKVSKPVQPSCLQKLYMKWHLTCLMGMPTPVPSSRTCAAPMPSGFRRATRGHPCHATSTLLKIHPDIQESEFTDGSYGGGVLPLRTDHVVHAYDDEAGQ